MHKPVVTGFLIYTDFHQVWATELDLTKYLIVSIITGVGLLASALTLSASTTPSLNVAMMQAVVTEASSTVATPKTVKEHVNEFFKNQPIMIRIAWCESRFRQHGTDGKVFRGIVNKSDVGVMQINTYYHQKAADRMNLDLESIEGNMAYAKYLYEKEGTTPWNSSSPCWARGEEVAVR